VHIHREVYHLHTQGCIYQEGYPPTYPGVYTQHALIPRVYTQHALIPRVYIAQDVPFRVYIAQDVPLRVYYTYRGTSLGVLYPPGVHPWVLNVRQVPLRVLNVRQVPLRVYYAHRGYTSGCTMPTVGIPLGAELSPLSRGEKRESCRKRSSSPRVIPYGLGHSRQFLIFLSSSRKLCSSVCFSCFSPF